MKRKLGITALTATIATLAFAGAANAASVTTSAESLSFGNQTAGTTSAPQTVTIDVPCLYVLDLGKYGGKSCSAPGQVTGIATTGDFTQTNNCVLPMNNGAVDGTVLSCTVSVRFTPDGTGAKTGELDLAAYGYADTYKVPLDGTGVTPPVDKPADKPGDKGGQADKGTQGSNGTAGAVAKKCKKVRKGASKSKKKCKTKKRR